MSSNRTTLLSTYRALPTGEQRLEWLIERTPEHGRLPVEDAAEQYRIRECVSPLWLRPARAEGRCYFTCRGSSRVVEGVASFICDLLSGLTPEEVLEAVPEAVSPLRLDQLLSVSRRMAVERVVRTIEQFARSELVSSGAHSLLPTDGHDEQ